MTIIEKAAVNVAVVESGFTDAPLHPARWPVRPHLRPKDGWKLCTEADVRPELLAQYPNIVDEFNGAAVWVGEAQQVVRIRLSEALALPVAGEA